MAARHRESRPSCVGGRHNCAASSSSSKKFTNICQFSEIISLKWFHAPWRGTARAWLRSKGCSCLLVNPKEIRLKVTPGMKVDSVEADGGREQRV